MAGRLLIPTGMQFHLETNVTDELHTFTLTCNSTGGPVMEVNWTRNGEPVNEEWNQYSIITNLTQALYHNWLFVPGSYEGLYCCTVFNPLSSVTASLSVNGNQFTIILSLLVCYNGQVYILVCITLFLNCFSQLPKGQ